MSESGKTGPGDSGTGKIKKRKKGGTCGMEAMNNEIMRMIMDMQTMHVHQQAAADKFMEENDGKDQYGL